MRMVQNVILVVLIMFSAGSALAHEGHGLAPGFSHDLVHASWIIPLLLVLPWWRSRWRRYRAARSE
jgi:hypothetical protein